MNSDILVSASVTVLERDVATSVRPYAPAGVMQPVEDDWATARVEIVVDQFAPEIEALLGRMELDDDEPAVVEYKPKEGELVVRLGLISLDPVGGSA